MSLEAVRIPNESNKNPKTQLSSTVRPVCGEKEETLERAKFDHDTLSQEKHDEVADPTSTEKPVSVHESTNVAC